MNLLSHQFRKDCFRLRVPIALWLLLVLLRAALITPGLVEPGEDASLVLYRIFTTLVPFLQNILLLVMVPLLIHEEPLVGTTAFWFTRPIDGWLLLRSKMLFIAVVFILAPLLTEIGILAIHGASARQLALAGPEILLEDLKYFSYVVVLAALTLTFARYALLGSSILIGYYLVGIVVSLLHLYVDLPRFLLGTQGSSLGDSRYVASTLALIAFAVMVLAYQGHTRCLVGGRCSNLCRFHDRLFLAMGFHARSESPQTSGNRYVYGDGNGLDRSALTSYQRRISPKEQGGA